MEENKIVIYQTEDGQTQIDVRLEQDMIWLTRQQLADLFGRDYKTISKHINNALKEELADSVVVAKFANTTQHGAIEGKTQTHEKDYFNLEMVTSVGYRVKSKRGVQFRRWANRILKEYLVKGYAVNERLRKEQIGELRQLVGMTAAMTQVPTATIDFYKKHEEFFMLDKEASFSPDVILHSLRAKSSDNNASSRWDRFLGMTAAMTQVPHGYQNHPLRYWYYGHFHESWHAQIDDVMFHMLDIMELREIPPKDLS